MIKCSTGLWTLVLLLFSSLSMAQTEIIKGQILSLKQGQVVAGVNIQLDERQGTVSDTDGFFELPISAFPAQLRFSHIAYQSQEIRLTAPSDSILLVFLTAKATDLEEVVVSAPSEVQAFSEATKYSVQDFEILGDYLFRLEYYGSFKPYRLALIDGEGKLHSELWLRKIKAIEGLYRGCNQDLYLVTNGPIYTVNHTHGQLTLGKTLSATTFNQLIKPCQLLHQQKLYYLVERENGLQQTLRSYDLQSKETETIRNIGDQEQIANYRTDQYYIRRSENSLSMVTNDYDTNLAKRRFQADGEFLSRVFYRPDFRARIMSQQGTVLLFNHAEGQLEIYQEDKFQESIPLTYVEADDWLENIVIDWAWEEAYALFGGAGQIRLRRIDTFTGEVETAAIIDRAPGRLLKLRMVKGNLYYLVAEPGENYRRVLYGQGM